MRCVRGNFLLKSKNQVKKPNLLQKHPIFLIIYTACQNQGATAGSLWEEEHWEQFTARSENVFSISHHRRVGCDGACRCVLGEPGNLGYSTVCSSTALFSFDTQCLSQLLVIWGVPSTGATPNGDWAACSSKVRGQRYMCQNQPLQQAKKCK